MLPRNQWSAQLAFAVSGLLGCLVTAAAAESPTSGNADFIASQPVGLQPYFKVLYDEGDRNAVLNFDRLAVAALASHNYDIARKALDQSISRIDEFRTSGNDLKYAKSKFGDEANKDFKGEPYERGMTFYYRGIVYLHDGDFSNAAASFARVNVEDSAAEGEQYRGDYSSMKFLQAWALKCQDEASTSASLYAEATKLRGELSQVDYRSSSLVIMETGSAPQKTGTGKWHEKLGFTDGGADDSIPSLAAGSTALSSAVRSESLFFQASTRGGRPVEYILAGKANFKEGAQTASNVSAGVAVGAAAAANIQSASGNYQSALNSSYLSMASSLFSLGSSIMANAAQPAADIRSWGSVPGSIWLATPAIAPDMLDGVTATIDAVKHVPDLQGRLGSCAVNWYRLAPVPVATPDPVEKVDATKEAKVRLGKFQASLSSIFQ